MTLYSCVINICCHGFWWQSRVSTSCRSYPFLSMFLGIIKSLYQILCVPPLYVFEILSFPLPSWCYIWHTTGWTTCPRPTQRFLSVKPLPISVFIVNNKLETRLPCSACAGFRVLAPILLRSPQFHILHLIHEAGNIVMQHMGRLC